MSTRIRAAKLRKDGTLVLQFDQRAEFEGSGPITELTIHNARIDAEIARAGYTSTATGLRQETEPLATLTIVGTVPKQARVYANPADALRVKAAEKLAAKGARKHDKALRNKIRKELAEFIIDENSDDNEEAMEDAINVMVELIREREATAAERAMDEVRPPRIHL